MTCFQSPMMELFATGFNAWHQLEFDKSRSSAKEPKDVRSFECVLTDSTIERLYATTTCTLVQNAQGILSAGSRDAWVHLPDLKEKIVASSAAVAGNGAVAVFDGLQTIQQYQYAAQYQAQNPQYIFTGIFDIVQLVAYETGFAALSANGMVWTWGDGRYSGCLGREVTQDSPAEKPGVVAELEDLPTGRIKKLAAGGYVVMALTEGKDLYAWGSQLGRFSVLPELTGEPSPVVVEEKDVLDCAVGEYHAVVLTVEKEVFVIGNNKNGQLGLDVEKTTSWTKVPLALRADSVASAVACGPRSSFVLVSTNNIP